MALSKGEFLRMYPNLPALPEVEVPLDWNTHEFYTASGDNPDIDTADAPEDVWDAGGEWPGYVGAGDVTVVSNSGQDAAGGTGATGTRFWGTNDAGVITTGAVTPTGVVAAASGVDLIAVFEAWVNAAGTDESNAGTLTFTIGGVTVAEIQPLAGRAQSAIRPVPPGYQGFIIGVEVSASEIGTGVGHTVAELKTAVTGSAWQRRLSMSIEGTGGPYIAPLRVAIPLQADAVAKVSCAQVMSNNIHVSALLTMLLVAHQN